MFIFICATVEMKLTVILFGLYLTNLSKPWNQDGICNITSSVFYFLADKLTSH